MENNQVIRVSTGRMIGSIALALLSGIALPIVALFQISLLVPVLMLGGMLAVWFKAKAGWIPAGVLIAVSVGATAWFMGIQMALMLFMAAYAPTIPIIWGMTRKRPFFEQMRNGVLAYVAGLILSTVIAYIGFGSGMVGQFVDLIRAEYDQMPDSALMPFVEWANSMLASSGAISARTMTVDTFRGQLTGILDLMQQTYSQALPGTLLCGAMLSGVLSVLWGNWTMARQGLATNESFIGMSRWFLPAQVSLGALGLWLVGIVLAYTGYENGATISFTIGEVAGAIFAIQALCALDRRMIRAGRQMTSRRVLITLFAALALILRDIGMILCYVGIASALFGSHCAIRLWMKRQQGDDHPNNDDPEE